MSSDKFKKIPRFLDSYHTYKNNNFYIEQNFYCKGIFFFTKIKEATDNDFISKVNDKFFISVLPNISTIVYKIK